MARGSLVWTDSKVELLLCVALDYKARKAQDNVDWESCQSKYVDMLAQFLEQYPSETNQDFPHVKEEITSGHGRVVLLYFELCEQVWGGSPATTTIASGIETDELEDSVAPSPATSSSSLVEVDAESEAEVQDVDGSVAINPTVKQRRDLLQSVVNRDV
ncbi:transcription initiation factor TFIID subunit 3-like protein [Labeo rohita]|uniref:Transcription initiation factor TFIID subunit 3-like protein n=1 Tax=Labeo rohita TaxID=84645 RepID=A0A498P366_LABRO|nr:transcription initiation factor TFIID subunit 3-like protein [Labeo rohita]